MDIYVKPTVHPSWETSVEHYRCHMIWVKDNNKVWIRNTVFFKHQYLTIPTVTTADALLNAAEDLTKEFDGNIPQSNPSRETTERFMGLFNSLTVKTVPLWNNI